MCDVCDGDELTLEIISRQRARRGVRFVSGGDGARRAFWQSCSEGR